MASSTRRISLVTGGDRGIGYGVAELLAARGDAVVLASPDAHAGGASAAKLPGASHVPADVTDRASVAALATAVADAHGRVDILVNCAGINLDQGGSRVEGRIGALIGDAVRGPVGEGWSIVEADPRIVDAAFQVNCLGALRVTQAFLPGMLERGFGRVVNVSSERGSFAHMQRDGDGGAPGYQVSKTALNAVTVMLAKAAEDSPDVLVNAACPGWTKTEMGGPFAERTVEQAAESILNAVDLPPGGPSGGFFRDGDRLSW